MHSPFFPLRRAYGTTNAEGPNRAAVQSHTRRRYPRPAVRALDSSVHATNFAIRLKALRFIWPNLGTQSFNLPLTTDSASWSERGFSLISMMSKPWESRKRPSAATFQRVRWFGGTSSTGSKCQRSRFGTLNAMQPAGLSRRLIVEIKVAGSS